nr:PEPxxWA-CTERM sorting domain-containing protein [Sandaracinobacter neustonicus]
MRTLLASLAGAMLLASLPSAASAAVCPTGPATILTYNINSLDVAVDNVIHFNTNPGCGAGRGGTFSFEGNASTSFDLWYGEPQSQLFLMGTAQNLPGDPEGQKHIVIFGNTDWVAGAEDIAWGTLFPTILEGQLIAALEDAATGEGQQSSYDLIDSFWFDHALPSGLFFGPNSDFTVIAFSTGQIIGSGNVTSTSVLPAVPEPATWAMLIAGFGLVGAAARRRRALAASA